MTWDLVTHFCWVHTGTGKPGTESEHGVNFVRHCAAISQGGWMILQLHQQ